MPFLLQNGRKIYYTREPAIGRKQAETIVLIHTNVTDHSVYDRIVPYLRKEYHVIRYDLAGFGLSEQGNQPVTLASFVEDFNALVTSLALPPFYVIAIGFGGFIALEYSKKHRDMVRKLVLMTMPCFPQETLDTVRKHRRKISLDGTQIPAHNIMKKVTLLDEHDPEYIRLHRIMSRQSVSTYVSIMDLTVSADTIAYLTNNEIPTLILAGEHEIVFPQNVLAAKCAFLPGHKYAVVPDASSFLMIDQPEITAKLATAHFQTKHSHGRYKDEHSRSISEEVRKIAQNYYHMNLAPAQQPNRIQIDCLYTLRVILNGNTVVKGLNRRYAKNILLYLLFHPRTTREELCEQLWPQQSLGIARQNLRVYLYDLKNSLRPYASEQQPIVVSDREYIYLNGEPDSDVLTLLSDLQQVSLLENRDKYLLASSIMSRIPFPHFMTAMTDQWFLNMRYKIEEELVNLFVWTAHWLVDQGRAQEGLKSLKQGLKLFDENIHIYEALIELSKQISDDAQSQYWIDEKMKVWG